METAKSWRDIALTILLATVVAGTLDITDACLWWGITKGVPPERIFQSVASGLLGKAAYKGGASTAAVYVLASQRLKGLTRRPIVMGLAYGAATYVVMNYVVLPLSQVGPRGPFVLPSFINGLMAHLILVGLTIAMIAASREKMTSTA